MVKSRWCEAGHYWLHNVDDNQWYGRAGCPLHYKVKGKYVYTRLRLGEVHTVERATFTPHIAVAEYDAATPPGFSECPPIGKRHYVRRPPSVSVDASRYAFASRISDYGLTVEDYAWMVHMQGFRCAICDESMDGTWMTIDHDHACCPAQGSCGRCVRGITHRGCNVGFGNFNESAKRLRKAAEYAERWASMGTE